MNNTITRFAFLVTFLFAGLLASTRVNAQHAWWALVNGSPTPNAATSYGQQGTASPTNTPGGRINMPSWVDNSGNFWIFGGMNSSQGVFDDLWKYDPKNKVWTWVSGSSGTGVNAGTYTGATSHPGGRTNAAGWSDQQGNFWIFGGYGYDANGGLGLLSDLWKYTPGTTPGTTGTWTFMKGDQIVNQNGFYSKATDAYYARVNHVGARQYTSGWSDASGNVWIFGGFGYNGTGQQGPLNDLWEYNASANLWYWVSGSNDINAIGTYGTRKKADANNVPGSRYGQNVIVDAQGYFWLFGGATSAGVDIAPPNNIDGQFNDLWKFDPNSKNWTWVAGSNQTNQTGVYGKQGAYTAGLAPGARFQGAFQIDINGNFWVYGGYGLDANFDGWAELSDYWVYNPNVDLWAYINGPMVGAGPSPGNSVVGTAGQAAPGNLPSGRQGFASWMDQLGNLSIFGGGTGAPNEFGNDLWSIPTVTVTLALREVTLQGAPQGQGNLLTWQTVGELDMANFQVQRSTDGSNFAGIGAVTAVGNGDNSYSYYDAVLPAGVSSFYYRLKMVNDDSTFSYSSIIALHHNTSGSGAILYPNPAQNVSTLQIPANSGLLNTPATLFDVSGRMIRQYLITGQQQQLDLTNIPQGVYLLKLFNGTALSLVKD